MEEVGRDLVGTSAVGLGPDSGLFNRADDFNRLTGPR